MSYDELQCNNIKCNYINSIPKIWYSPVGVNYTATLENTEAPSGGKLYVSNLNEFDFAANVVNPLLMYNKPSNSAKQFTFVVTLWGDSSVYGADKKITFTMEKITSLTNPGSAKVLVTVPNTASEITFLGSEIVTTGLNKLVAFTLPTEGGNYCFGVNVENGFMTGTTSVLILQIQLQV